MKTRNLKTKTLSILLAIVMLLGMLPISVFAAAPKVVKSYSVATLYSDGTLEIFEDVSRIVTVPWQNERTSIIKVVFTVDTQLSQSLFSDCTNLAEITLPSMVTEIPLKSFNNCTSLTSITIPDSVTSIGERAFSDCKKLSSITFGESSQLQTIGIFAFNNCDVLESIAIPNTVTSIGNSAFNSCDALASIVIPDSVTSISNGAFSSCKALASIAIPDSVSSIGEMAFYNCNALASITIPNSVSSIGEMAFYDCDALTSITIPNSVTSIGKGAFYDCDGLASIRIPDSVTSIGDQAFFNCNKLTDIHYDGTVESWNSITKGMSMIPNSVKINHTGSCVDDNTEHTCDLCGKNVGSHADIDKDHICDYGCTVTIGTCEDADKDHDCDYGCDKVYGVHEDANTDHVCDYGCSVAIGAHADSGTDADHLCDYGCGATLENCTDAVNDNNHSCDVCGKADVSTHTYGNATCEAPATCSECGTTTGEKLGHTYGTEWKSDSTNHWHECTCGAKTEEAAHSGGTATCTEKAICTTCGQPYGEVLGHTYGTEWKSDGTNHWHECTCGAKAEEAAHSGGTATCTEKAKCTVCAVEYGNLAEHTYGTEWKSDGTNHWHECSCGAKTEEAAHSGGTATCKDKAVCSACNVAYGELAAHNYKDGMCTVCEAVDPNYVPETDSPQTGDNSHMALWIALLFISGGAVITLTVYDRKKRRQNTI